MTKPSKKENISLESGVLLLVNNIREYIKKTDKKVSKIETECLLLREQVKHLMQQHECKDQ